jgi:hypothetical protein
MFLHDPFTYPKSKAGPGEFLRRLKWFEQTEFDLRADSLACIRHRQPHAAATVMPVLLGMQTNHQASSLTHRIKRIPYEVIHHLTNLSLHRQHVR